MVVVYCRLEGKCKKKGGINNHSGFCLEQAAEE